MKMLGLDGGRRRFALLSRHRHTLVQENEIPQNSCIARIALPSRHEYSQHQGEGSFYGRIRDSWDAGLDEIEHVLVWNKLFLIAIVNSRE